MVVITSSTSSAPSPAAAAGLSHLGGAVSTRSQVRPGLYEDTSTAVTWQGPWRTRRVSPASGGTLAGLAHRGSAQIGFTGTGVVWVTRLSPYDGEAQIYLDGHRTTTVDLYARTTAYRQVGYRVQGLRNGRHSLRVVRTAHKNRASAGRNVTVDAFRVLDSTAPPPPTGLTATRTRTGASLSWASSPVADLSGYRLTREAASGTSAVVGATSPGAPRLEDVGLRAGARYVYTVQAVDTSGNLSSPSAGVTFTMPPASPDPGSAYAQCPAATVSVGDDDQLAAAVQHAGAGTVVGVRPGRYTRQLQVSVTGTAAAPVWICGPRTAVFDGGDSHHNAGIRVSGSAHLVIAGVTVRDSQKGVSVLDSQAVVLAHLRVEHIGDEGIHLKNGTTASTVVDNVIDGTGLVSPQYGEGVYVGTDKDNWCAYTGCAPDRSDQNAVVGNTVTGTRAEPIEVKEGTTGGLIAGNDLDGSDTTAGVGRLIAVKGNGWVVSGNAGVDAGLDGVQVLQRLPGDGVGNVIYANTFSGRLTGYAVRLSGDVVGNVVGCDNVVPGAARGIANDTCQP